MRILCLLALIILAYSDYSEAATKQEAYNACMAEKANDEPPYIAAGNYVQCDDFPSESRWRERAYDSTHHVIAGLGSWVYSGTTPTCQTNATYDFDASSCLCNSGYLKSGSQCVVDNYPQCNSSQIIKDDTGQCPQPNDNGWPPGYQCDFSGELRTIDGCAQTCGEGQYLNEQNTCSYEPTCFGNQTLVDHNCIDPVCEGDQTVVNGVCTDPTCTGGQTVQNGVCTDPTCVGEQTYNAETHSCVAPSCETGYSENQSSHNCEFSGCPTGYDQGQLNGKTICTKSGDTTQGTGTQTGTETTEQTTEETSTTTTNPDGSTTTTTTSSTSGTTTVNNEINVTLDTAGLAQESTMTEILNQLTKSANTAFDNAKTTGLEGGITAGYERAKTLLCDNGDCTTGPTCATGQCSSLERIQTIKNKLTVSGFASVGDCPTAPIDLTMIGLGSHEISSQCLLLEQVRPTITVIGQFLAAIMFVFIILGA